MSVIENTLAGVPVLVTGATGFIGSHLAERLARDEQALVTGTGRNLSAVPFLQDAGVTLQQADLLKRDEMAAAIAGKKIIFHVAAWLSTRTADETLARRINVDATRELIELAAEHGVERVVLVSSIASYGAPSKIMMDEFMPVATQQPDLYGRTKALGEMVARDSAEAQRMPLTIVRPGMVYGPRSYSWTVGMLNMVKKGVPTLFGRADGHAFPIYIDNLIDMLLLAAVKPDAVGEAFNAVDPPITWKQFFSYYGDMAGRKPRRIPMPLARLIVTANGLFNLGIPLSSERLAFYVTKTVYPITKAREKLGYTPNVDIDEGMRRSRLWLAETKQI